MLSQVRARMVMTNRTVARLRHGARSASMVMVGLMKSLTYLLTGSVLAVQFLSKDHVLSPFTWIMALAVVASLFVEFVASAVYVSTTRVLDRRLGFDGEDERDD